jgi:hypothetical protein
MLYYYMKIENTFTILAWFLLVASKINLILYIYIYIYIYICIYIYVFKLNLLIYYVSGYSSSKRGSFSDHVNEENDKSAEEDTVVRGFGYRRLSAKTD